VDDEFLTTQQTATLLHCSVRALHTRNHRGDGPPRYRSGGKSDLYLRSEVLAWLQSRRVQPKPAPQPEFP
jgi:hypothetical protein